MMDDMTGALVIGLTCLVLGFAFGDLMADANWVKDCTKIETHVVGDRVFKCSEVKK